jgi:membrane-bound ClpP family serine protease
VVCNAIEGVEGGRVVVDGVDWKARSVDGEDIAEGEKVEIVEIDSIVLIVKKL